MGLFVPRRARGGGGYFFFAGFEAFFCDSALPAADLEVPLVLPSRSVLEAALAAFSDVVSLGALVWVSALPAADFDALPVEPLDSVFEALLAAALPVTFFAISDLSCVRGRGEPGIPARPGNFRARFAGIGAGHAVSLPRASPVARAGMVHIWHPLPRSRSPINGSGGS